MSVTSTISPQSVQVYVGTHRVGGWAAGSFISIVKNAARSRMNVGADGRAVRFVSSDESATITFTLQQSSDSNDVLSAILAADSAALAAGGLGVPFLLKDGTGRTLATAAACFVEKQPDVTYSDSGESRTWTLLTGRLIQFVGGNGPTPTA